MFPRHGLAGAEVGGKGGTKHCILQHSGRVGGTGFAVVHVKLQLLHETLYFTAFWGDLGAASGRPRGDLGAASGRPRGDLEKASLGAR